MMLVLRMPIYKPRIIYHIRVCKFRGYSVEIRLRFAWRDYEALIIT